MRFVGTQRFAMVALAAATASWVGGCDEVRDPSTPCAALALGDAEPATVVSHDRAPVLAMAGGSTDPFVLHYVCPSEDADASTCELTRTELPRLAGKGENALLITSAGDYVVSTDREDRALRTFSFDALGRLEVSNDFVQLSEDLPVELITSLRNSNWVIGLDTRRQLRRYMPGERSADLLAEDHPQMTLAAVGEQHAIGRVSNGEQEDLYLVPVDEDLPDVNLDPILLLSGRPATRVVVSPRDEHVAVTLGHGDNATTLVFRVPDGVLLDRFAGEMVSGREDMTELPGLRAVSPDGSHLAYRTAAGSLALRDVASNSACLVRSASAAGDVRMAGFSAHGLLYFESKLPFGATAVSAWDASNRFFSALSQGEDGYHLAAVPSRSSADARPWAIGVNSGAYAALQDASEPERLDLHAAVFVPRDDADLWVLDSSRLDSGGNRLGLRRIDAEVADDNQTMRIAGPTHTQHTGPGGGHRAKLEVFVSGPQTACLSTGTPGARGYTCDSGNNDRFFSGATVPQGEDPSRPPRSPEVPDLDDVACRDGGDPLSRVGDNDCKHAVSGCCFDTFEAACDAAGCPIDACELSSSAGQVATVTCGTSAAKP